MPAMTTRNQTLRWIGSLLIILTVVFPALQPATAEDLRVSRPGPEFLIVGHMGAPIHEVENTLPSFQKALELGANAIETDVCITKDGEVVLWHDWSPNAAVAMIRQLGKQGLKARPYNPDLGTPFRKPVNELTLAELRQYYGYTLRQTTLGERKRLPHRIVTIQEFARWAATRDDLKRVFIDIKVPANRVAWVKPLLRRICRVLSESELLDKAAFMSPEPVILDAIAEMNDIPDITVVHDQELPPGIIISPKKFSTVQKAINRKLPLASIGRPVATLMGFTIYKKIITYDLKLARIHNFQKKTPAVDGVIAWTIDKPEEMRELIRLGVSGVLTNRPDLLSKVVESWK